MKPMLILVADDEAYVTTVVGAQLRRRGYEVIVAGDGQEALALAQEHHPDLIVSDYQMPLVSGLEMAMQLRKDARTCDIPIIMMTARGHRLRPSELAQTNIQCLQSKPFSIKELLSKVEELAARRRETADPSPARDVA